MKSKIYEFMIGKDNVTLQEFYSGLPDLKQYAIRAVLNNGVKLGTIIRVCKATYKIKQ